MYLCYSSFVSFEVSFKYIKSSKCTKLFKIMYSMNLYYNIYVLEPLGHRLRAKMNTNALETMLILFVYSSFLSFVTSFKHIKLSKCTKLF
jgi:hypothetical protein